MTNRDIEDMKNRIDELEEMIKIKSDENELLNEKNKALKQKNECLEDILESIRRTERPEDAMRKTGLFSEEEIQAHMRANEKIWKDMNETVSQNAINKDTLIAKLHDQRQQDCIKINQLHVTIDTLVDKYARIRKTVGMD